MIHLAPHTRQAYKLLHDGSLALAIAEYNGMRIDVEYCRKQEKRLEREIAYIENKMDNAQEVKKWKRVYKTSFNLNSNDQLAKVLFEYCGYKSENKTEKGNYKVDQATLEALKLPIVSQIIKLRQLKKAKNTYLKNYIREQVDEYLHPFYHLERVWTYRSSSSHINFQNQPVRVPFIKKIVRQAVIPRPDHMIVEVDYSGVEVRIAACYHKDPNMLDEIKNPKRDMHRDMAQACYLLGDDEWTKTTRYCGKNKFVFPQFYGDYYKSCAKALWEAIDQLKLETKQGMPLKKHLSKKGIRSYPKFEQHLEKVEHHFWNEKFGVYGKWKEDHFKRYEKTGYVELFTGFTCRGYMRKNQVINCPVQGAAFHCLLKSFIEITNWLDRTNKRSKAIGQIHDSIVLDVHVDEFYRVIEKCRQIMTKKILDEWKWIIVPLDIEVETTPVNSSWLHKQEVFKHKCSCGFRYQYREKVGEKTLWQCPACREKTEE